MRCQTPGADEGPIHPKAQRAGVRVAALGLPGRLVRGAGLVGRGSCLRRWLRWLAEG
jgi:hypothetical protein